MSLIFKLFCIILINFFNSQVVCQEIEELSGYTFNDSSYTRYGKSLNIKTFVINKSSTLTKPNMMIPNVKDESFEGFKSDGFKMNFLPLNFHEVFPNLQFLYIRNASLKEIHKIELEGFKKLIIIKMQNNKIESLEENLFIGNSKLIYIDLSGNKIKCIHPKAFNGLLFLNCLKLSGNICEFKDYGTRADVKKIIQEISNLNWNNQDDKINNEKPTDVHKKLNSTLTGNETATEDHKNEIIQPQKETQNYLNSLDKKLKILSSEHQKIYSTFEKIQNIFDDVENATDTTQKYLNEITGFNSKLTQLFNNLKLDEEKILEKNSEFKNLVLKIDNVENFINNKKSIDPKRFDILLIFGVSQIILIILILIILIVIFKDQQKSPDYAKNLETSKIILETKIEKFEAKEPKNVLIFHGDYAEVQPKNEEFNVDYEEVQNVKKNQELKNLSEEKFELELPAYATVDKSMKSKNHK